MKKNYKTIFFGTPGFALPILGKLINLPYIKLNAVVTQPDKPVGRKQTLTPSPIKILAEKNQISVLQPQNIKTEKFEEEIRQFNPDLIVLVAYGKIIPKNLLKIPKHGWLNIHASLLPKFRGASPIQSAIKSGEKETGVSLMKLDKGMDTGPIIAQLKTFITPDENSQTLHDKLSRLGAEILKSHLLLYLEEKIKPKPQDNSKATYTKIIKKEDGKIDWSKKAEEIERQIRAFTPWPGTWCYWSRINKNEYRIKNENNNKLIERRLKIIRAKVLNPHISCADSSQFGKVFLTADNKIAVTCGQGSLLIDKLQLEGKKEMEANEFLKGYPEFGQTLLS